MGIDRLEEVKVFKYLGVDFSFNLSWVNMKERVVKKAWSRLALVSNAVAQGLPPEASLKVWYSLVRPLLEYASEIWNVSKWPEAERIQLEFGRKVLGVGPFTCSDVIRGELGLWTMEARGKLAILRWWGKLVSMKHDRLCYQIYHCRRANMLANKKSWCKKVRELLYELELGPVWESEDISDLSWNEVLKLHIGQKENKDWLHRITEMSKLRLYRQLKSELSFENYLKVVSDFKHRRTLARIRSGTHELSIETGRWAGESVNNRTCPTCLSGAVEDEAHLLLDCISYDTLRGEMLEKIRIRTGDRVRFNLLHDDHGLLAQSLLGERILDTGNKAITQREVAKFLYRALKLRKHLLN